MDKLVHFVSTNWILVGAFFLILFFLVKSFLDMKGIISIKPFAAVELINREDAVILDVRLDNEFKDGHIRDSVHIPLGLLSNRLKELDGNQTRPLVVSCRSGNRSRQACSMLRKNGFEKLYLLDGGVMAWQNANLPISKS